MWFYFQYVRQRYQKWREDEQQSQSVCFEGDTITLDLPPLKEADPQNEAVDQWNIIPMTPPQVDVYMYQIRAIV